MIAYAVTEKGPKTFWTRIGAAVAHRDGSIQVTLEAVPTNGRMVLRADEPAAGNRLLSKDPEFRAAETIALTMLASDAAWPHGSEEKRRAAIVDAVEQVCGLRRYSSLDRDALAVSIDRRFAE